MNVLAQYLPDLFTPVVARMVSLCGFPIYYDWGHKIEMTQKLSLLDASKTQKTKKYPLVWLVMDFEETKGSDINTYSTTSLSWVFAVSTNPGYTEQERRDKTFLPTLLPMYQAFLQALSEQAAFRKPYAPTIKHSFALRPYWGDGQNKNLFNDFIDAIEISKLTLDVAPKLCVTPPKFSFK